MIKEVPFEDEKSDKDSAPKMRPLIRFSNVMSVEDVMREIKSKVKMNQLEGELEKIERIKIGGVDKVK